MNGPTCTVTQDFSYGEVFEIALRDRGIFRIVLNQGVFEVEFCSRDGARVRFIDHKTAHADCGDPDRSWRDGWIEGHEQAMTENFQAIASIEEWHNESHAGVVKFCTQEPCHGLRKAGVF